MSLPITTIATDHNPLTTLIRRLEAATSRLEDIASSAASFDASRDGSTPIPTGGPASSSADELPALVDQASHTHAPKAEPLPPAVSELDELMEKELREFVEASKPIDPSIEQQAQSLARAFADQRRFILVSTKSKKPDLQSPKTQELLLGDLQKDAGNVGEIKDRSRNNALRDQLSMISDGTGVLYWMVMEGKPSDYVGEIIGGVQMYGNRVLTKHKDK